MTPVTKLSPITDEATIKAIASAVSEMQRASSPLRFDVLKWAVSLVVAALVAYGVANGRISVLESRVGDMKSDIQEIRQDIKTLLTRSQR